ncbi:hypothetical protein [Pseudarthrobacter sp. NamE5]|uniref:hypothetical protein n=1 Tax=Pseudarthrobacter sp. NamE5 TaxID=2576839 RepID=UPI00110BAC07|nr:hypothetical protein [Pseudarthrobacter sp. NamE5]TLM80812.1 hypothetical protein FDW84_18345 [Pseudarthrobacter sp. NamE5]
MNLSDVRYPADTKQTVRNLLVQEAHRRPKTVPWWRKPAALTFAGLALAGSTAAGVYVALAPVDDKRDIRCYYRADLTTAYPIPGAPNETRPPYITTGVFITGFDAKNNPNPDDLNAGMQQVADPINLCSRAWDMGSMNLEGFDDDLIPDDFVSPPPGLPAERTLTETMRDQNGNPLYPDPAIRTFGNYIPFLTECVVDNTVAVIPGPAEVCAQLGIPALEK